jgi:hypothetical protein
VQGFRDLDGVTIRSGRHILKRVPGQWFWGSFLSTPGQKSLHEQAWCAMIQTETNDLSQKEIDEREWNDPQNWHWIFYFSRKDSRTFVPKRRGFGSTFNFARRGTLWIMLVLLLMPLAIVGGVLLSRVF